MKEHCNIRIIPLTKNKFTVVDVWNYEWLNQWKWFTFPSKRANGITNYACRNTYPTKKNQKRQMIWMHRLIMNPINNYITEHINGNKLDNRESNLRNIPKGKSKQNKVGYKNRRSYHGKNNPAYIQNEFFKKIDSPEKAWILGWIVTDGTISDKRKRVKIAIQEDDKYVLEKMHKIIPNSNLHLYSRNSDKWANIIELTVNSIDVINDIHSHGIPLGKKNTITKPLNLKELMPYFWLGVFEGDGSIHIKKDKRYPNCKDATSIQLTGSKELTLGFSRYLGYGGDYIYYNKNDGTYVFRKSVTKRWDLTYFFNKIYPQYMLRNKLYLPRKLNKFIEQLNYYSDLEEKKPLKIFNEIEIIN